MMALLAACTWAALWPAASATSVLDLPPGPQFSPAQKKAQLALGAALPAQITAAYTAGAAEVSVPAGDYRWAAPTSGADIWPLVLESLRRPPEDPFTISADGAVTLWFETRNGVCVCVCVCVCLCVCV